MNCSENKVCVVLEPAEGEQEQDLFIPIIWSHQLKLSWTVTIIILTKVYLKGGGGQRAGVIIFKISLRKAFKKNCST
jgi:hypothetical protein